MTKPEPLDQLRARLSTEKCGLDTARLLDYIDRLETAVNYLPPRDQIRAVLLDCGYRIKEGQTDLADYVYKAAYVLLNMRRAGGGFPGEITPAMLTAAEDAYMPFGDMQAAIVAALAHAPEDEEAVTPIKSDAARREQQAVNDALRRAAHCCYLLDNSDNSPSYRAAATWCAERILALCTPQEENL